MPYPTQSSNLTSGSPPRPYGAVPPNNGTPSNCQHHCPPSYTPYSAAPGPTQPHGLVSYPTNRRTPTILTRGLVVCLAVVLLQTVLIVYSSDTLKRFIDLESAARRVSRERDALVEERERSEQEREKSGWEREKMRRDRELWEKALEDRVPLGAFWDVIWPALDCRAYGKREYWAMLHNVPEGWSDVDACMSMPAEIKGVTFRRPDRCAFVKGSPYIRGYWMVDWDQPDCQPWYHNCHDVGCTSYKSGARRIEGELKGINNRKEQDWWLLCSTTPLVWDLVTYNSPTHCEERGGRKFAMWDIPDNSCLYM